MHAVYASQIQILSPLFAPPAHTPLPSSRSNCEPGLSNNGLIDSISQSGGQFCRISLFRMTRKTKRNGRTYFVVEGVYIYSIPLMIPYYKGGGKRRAQVDKVTRVTVWMPRRKPLANGFRCVPPSCYWPIDGCCVECCLFSFQADTESLSDRITMADMVRLLLCVHVRYGQGSSGMPPIISFVCDGLGQSCRTPS
jgi:hypothetical protein